MGHLWILLIVVSKYDPCKSQENTSNVILLYKQYQPLKTVPQGLQFDQIFLVLTGFTFRRTSTETCIIDADQTIELSKSNY